MGSFSYRKLAGMQRSCWLSPSSQRKRHRGFWQRGSWLQLFCRLQMKVVGLIAADHWLMTETRKLNSIHPTTDQQPANNQPTVAGSLSQACWEKVGFTLIRSGAEWFWSNHAVRVEETAVSPPAVQSREEPSERAVLLLCHASISLTKLFLTWQ